MLFNTTLWGTGNMVVQVRCQLAKEPNTTGSRAARSTCNYTLLFSLATRCLVSDVISYAEGLLSDAEVEIESLQGEIEAAQVRGTSFVHLSCGWVHSSVVLWALSQHGRGLNCLHAYHHQTLHRWHGRRRRLTPMPTTMHLLLPFRCLHRLFNKSNGYSARLARSGG